MKYRAKLYVSEPNLFPKHTPLFVTYSCYFNYPQCNTHMRPLGDLIGEVDRKVLGPECDKFWLDREWKNTWITPLWESLFIYRNRKSKFV